MSKTYILDTNVILHDPYCFKKFSGNKVIIPLSVIEEIDDFKSNQDTTGENARIFSRTLDEMMSKGNLSEGIYLEDCDIELGVDQNHYSVNKLPNYFRDDKIDNNILSAAKHYHNNESKKTVLISKDVNMRIKAHSLGLNAENYMEDVIDYEEIYKGYEEVDTTKNIIDNFYKNGQVEIDQIVSSDEAHPYKLYNLKCGSSSALGIYNHKKDVIETLNHSSHLWGIEPKNREQQFAFELLQDNRINLVSLIGKAGVGKTLIALAAGLDKVLNKDQYNKLVILRPIVPMGNDIGYLPGSKEEKLSEWMKPIEDNFEFLLGDDMNKTQKQTTIDYLAESSIDVEALTYIRGRSIPNQYIVLDECFPYDQQVLTEIGKMSIGSLFVRYVRKNEKMPKVKTYNTQADEYEWKEIVNVQHNGVKELVQVNCGKKTIKCTPNHPFLTEDGWKPAIKLNKGDNLVVHGNSQSNVNALNEDQLQVVYGSYLGDGNLRKTSKGSYRMKVIHSEDQESYLRFKAGLFKRKDSVKKIEDNGHVSNTAYRFNTKTFALPFSFNGKKKKHINEDILNNMDERALAIFYMDDGSLGTKHKSVAFHTQFFTKEANQKIKEVLTNRFGLNAKVQATKGKYYSLRLNKKSAHKLFQIISKYMHENLNYKLPEKYRNKTGEYDWDNAYKNYKLTAVNSIEEISENEHVFNMEVKDNHNYIANVGAFTKENNVGFVVHNCQNLSPHELKTVLTRVGKGSKIVLTGDPNQIDNPYLDKNSNGLTYATEKMKGSELSGTVLLNKGERSSLAEEATVRL